MKWILGRRHFLRTTVGVLAVVTAGFWLSGSPAQARMLQQDAQRVQDLTAIYRSIDRYYSSKGSLPETLEDCDNNPDTYIAQKTDRVTGAPYGYRVLNQDCFELKATFALASQSDRTPGVSLSPAQEGFWLHEAGEQTFAINATKETHMPTN